MKNANLADAVVKMHAAMRRGRPIARIVDTIARGLERDGDAHGASIVRGILQEQRPGFTSLAQADARQNSSVRWFDPEPVDFVSYGTTGPLLDRLTTELLCVPKFVAAGIDPPTRALFVGPSGTGKTLAARWIGHKLGLPVAVVVLDQTVSSHLGETSSKLAKLIEEATAIPSILFLDEIDGLCAARGSNGNEASKELERVTTTLVQRLDWLPPSQIVIVATNIDEALDPSVRRRLANRIVFGPPCAAARSTMVRRWLSLASLPAPKLDELVLTTGGLSGAELREVAMRAAREHIMAQEAEAAS